MEIEEGKIGTVTSAGLVVVESGLDLSRGVENWDSFGGLGSLADKAKCNGYEESPRRGCFTL